MEAGQEDEEDETGKWNSENWEQADGNGTRVQATASWLQLRFFHIVSCVCC